MLAAEKKQQQINSKLKKEQHSFTMYMAALQCSNGVSLSNMAGRKKKENILAAEKKGQEVYS